MNTPDTEWEKEFDEMFEWTDFSGNIGSYVLVKKDRSYVTEETERNELKDFITTLLTSRDTYWKERVRKEVEGMKKDNVFVPDHDPSPYGGLICRECKAQEDCDCHVWNEALDTLLDKLK